MTKKADLKARVELWLEIAAAIGDAHDEGVVHRLLRPEVIQVKDFAMLDALELARQEARRVAEQEGEELAATGTGDFRAVAPAAQSFASGRRR